MKKAVLVMLIGLTSTLASFGSWAVAQNVVEVEVNDMVCPSCSRGLAQKLKQMPGVQDAEVSLRSKKARVVMVPGNPPDIARIKKSIAESGFRAGAASVSTQEK